MKKITKQYIDYNNPAIPVNLNSMDIYYDPARKATGCKVVLFVHGGGWVQGDKKGVGLNAIYFVSRGYIFISTNYRLLPGYKWPTQEQDVSAAVAYVVKHVAEVGGDPNKIYMVGHSAGSIITANVSCNENYLKAVGLPLTTIKGTILLDATYNYTTVQAIDPKRYKKLLELVGDNKDQQWEASPIKWVASNKGMPRFLCCYANSFPITNIGTNEFYQALLKAGIGATLKYAPNCNHTQIALGICQNKDGMGEAVLAFLNMV
jgi:arylformamidase